MVCQKLDGTAATYNNDDDSSTTKSITDKLAAESSCSNNLDVYAQPPFADGADDSQDVSSCSIYRNHIEPLDENSCSDGFPTSFANIEGAKSDQYVVYNRDQANFGITVNSELSFSSIVDDLNGAELFPSSSDGYIENQF